MDVQLPFQTGQGFEGVLGLEFTELTDEVVSGRVPVEDRLKQPYGLIHGGVYASIAETLASWGTANGVWAEGKIAVGLSNQTSFLRPVTEGAISATATRRHRGRSTWVWDVDALDNAGRLCAVSRVTIAVRDR